ncbi:MAG: flagellar motor switch protein FliM [Acidobacteriaceae bacterium]|nr:flagellar motor switch protein FliM [Acidobacteriaceae bacterium]
MRRVLSQQEIDAVFQGSAESKEARGDVLAFDFNRLDRLPKSQLRALHLVHENFVRNLASSLSAYLRSYVALNLVSMEQMSYGEFQEGLGNPTCIAYIGMAPYEATSVMELNMSLVFQLIELLLGSKGSSPPPAQRKITDIEKKLVQTLMRVVLRDLSEAWKSVADVVFSIQSLASEPQLLYVIAPGEAVIVIAIEVRVGPTSGLMNLAIPSIFIKRLRHKFDQLQKIRRAESTEDDQVHLAKLLDGATLTFQAEIDGGTVSAETLVRLELDQVLVLDHPAEPHVQGFLNGKQKLLGSVMLNRGKFAFQVHQTRAAQDSLTKPAQLTAPAQV